MGRDPALRGTPRLLVTLLLVVGIVAACGGSGDGGSQSMGPGPSDGGSGSVASTIDMTSSSSAYSSNSSFGFSPQVDTVAVGDTVQWTNGTSTTHTVTADDGSWDSGSVGGNGSYTRVFTQSGEHPYHCEFHGSPGSGMHGTVVVEQ